MKKSYEMDMCSGPLFSKIVIFALPLMCSGVLQLLFNAADIIVVGRFTGSDALAAVGSTSSLINLLVNLFIGISVGANVVVGRAYGARDMDGVQEGVHTAILTAAISGVAMIFVGILLSRPMLELMGTPENVLDQALLYIRIYFVGMPAIMLYNFGAAILRAIGDTKRPLYFLTVAGIVNVIFNLIFVIVFHLGVAGVAIATVISQMISASLILLSLLHTDSICRLIPSKLHIYPQKLKEILQVGLPAGAQSVVFNISNVLIQSSVNSFGSTVMAGNTASNNIEGFVYTAMNSVYQTALSFTSQNMGAKNYKRVEKVLLQCLLLVTGLGLVLGNLAHLLGPQLLSIYNTDPQVIAYGMTRLGVICTIYFLCGIMDVLAGTIRGMGYSILPMVVTLIGSCLFRIVWIFTVFQWNRTLFTLYLSYPISWGLTLLTHAVCFLIVRRKAFRPVESAQAVQR